MEKENNNQIVQYDNSLNKISLNTFTAIDQNFFITLCAHVKNKGTEEIELSFSKIKEETGYSTKNTNERFIKDLSRMNEKLLTTAFGYENERYISMFILFTDFIIDKKKQTLTVSVNEKYTYLLNELNKEFTKFKLKTFNNLSSKYSKTLFRIIMQFRTAGFVRIGKDELINIMGVPKTYKTNDMVRKILEPSIEELSPHIKGLKMEIVREKTRGNPVKEFIFTFEKEEKTQIERILEPTIEEKSVLIEYV